MKWLYSLVLMVLLFAVPTAAAPITMDFYNGTDKWMTLTLTEVSGGVVMDGTLFAELYPEDWRFDYLWFENGVEYWGDAPTFYAGWSLFQFYALWAYARFYGPCEHCEPWPGDPNIAETDDDKPYVPLICNVVLQAQVPSHPIPEPGSVGLVCIGLGAVVASRRGLRGGGSLLRCGLRASRPAGPRRAELPRAQPAA